MGPAVCGSQARQLQELDETRPKALLVDRGYDSDAIREDAWFHGTDPVIATKINRKVQRSVNLPLYALRNGIERFFDKLENARRVATPYHKTAASFLAFVQLASIKSGYALQTGPSWLAQCFGKNGTLKVWLIQSIETQLDNRSWKWSCNYLDYAGFSLSACGAALTHQRHNKDTDAAFCVSPLPFQSTGQSR